MTLLGCLRDPYARLKKQDLCGWAKLTLMATKEHLQDWVLEALEELGGSGTVVDVCEVVWRRHESDLRASGRLFYTWQYDIRWAAQKLRDDGRLRTKEGKRGGPWELA